MDYFIIIGAFVTFIMFLGIHVIVLRQISDRSVIPVFWMTYAAVSLVSHTILGTIILFIGLSVSTALFMVGVSWALSTLLIGNYFMGIFGLMESSIRMRALGEVVRAGSAGIQKRTLLAQYNHTKIVDRRLARFVASGDIERNASKYVSHRPITFFLLPALVLRFVWWAYGRTNIVYVK